MADSKQIDARLGAALASRDYAFDGIAGGDDRGFAWVVVDPERHPLEVWCRRSPLPREYGRTIASIAPAVATNGPLMGKHLAFGRKAERVPVAVDIGAVVASALVAGACIAGPARRVRGAVLASVVGVPAAWWHVFRRWESCGPIRSRRLGVREVHTFENEGPRHAWIGRSGTDFASYAIGRGDLPADVVEGMGGLVRVLEDGWVPATDPSAPGYDAEFARLAHKRGVAAWGLARLDHGSGVLVVAGASDRTAAEAGELLRVLGAHDAVATDLRRCALLQVDRRTIVGPPTLSRDMIQRYGLCCR